MTLRTRSLRLSVLFLLSFSTSARLRTEIASSKSEEDEQSFRTVEKLVEEWAPIIWLAPGERYLPLSVAEFLQHVYPADINGRSVSDSLPSGRKSNSLYLVTKRNLDSLKDEPSFLHGKDPSKTAVPVYVTVTQCLPRQTLENKTSFHLSYWMFYPYNEGKKICFIGRFPAPFIFNTCLGKTKTVGNHVGDFEHLSFSFRGRTVPDEMFLSVHDTGAYYKYDESAKLFRYDRQMTRKGIAQSPKFPPVVKLWKGRPVLFAALGSHGLWSAPGEHFFVRVPKLYDVKGFGIPWPTWKRLEIYHRGFGGPPEWMKYLGRWGNPKSNCFPFNKLGVCELSDGPWGILRRQQDFYC